MENSALPTFPQFAALEPHHQGVINQMVGSHPPYSDYNFISLWTYDYDRQYRLSVLNDNLIIKFQDYNDPNDFFYSFLGINQPDDTARLLLEHSAKEGQKELKLIPEEVIESFSNPDQFII